MRRVRITMTPWKEYLNQTFHIQPGPPYALEKELIQSVLKKPERFVAVDAGCGRNSNVGEFKTEGSLIIGIDEDAAALRANPDIDLGIVCRLEQMPFKEASFDLIHSRFVIEHLKEPDVAFKEFHRILKPSGHVLIWTVNIKNYAMLISRLTPTWFHNFFRKYLWGGEYDNVPTFYRANTQKALDKGLTRAGFKRMQLFLRGGAYLYLQFSRVSYFIGLVLNRFSDYGFLKRCKLFLFALYQKH